MRAHDAPCPRPRAAIGDRTMSIRHLFFTGAGAPPPARSDADASPRICSSSARHGRRRWRADDFTARVLAVVRRIPVGQVATYGDVAARAGRPRAARAVGNIMRTCGRPDVPCHRVIGSGGRLGGYGGSEALKRALLVAEGLIVRGNRVVLPGNARRSRSRLKKRR
jgi:methylated-DNA-[protein]-cysteine S-methyltransferase